MQARVDRRWLFVRLKPPRRGRNVAKAGGGDEKRKPVTFAWKSIITNITAARQIDLMLNAPTISTNAS